MWTVSAPVQVLCTKKTKFNLNLNQYRNAHHYLLNDAKRDFAEIVKPRLRAAGIPPLVQIRMSFILYTRTATLCDVSNVCSIVDKFFSDCLTAEQIIPDDNRNHVLMVAYGFGGIDRVDPRVDVIIEDMAVSTQSATA